MERGYSRLQWAARVSLVLLAVVSMSTMGWARQDILEKSKDVIIDKPVEGVQNVFDNDDNSYRDQSSDNQYNSSSDNQHNACCPSKVKHEACAPACPTREKPAKVEACAPACPKPTKVEACPSEPPACPAKTCGAEPQGTAESPIPVTIDDLRHHGECYYGKYVTVDGKLDDTFTDQAFTIKGNGHEVLVLSDSAMCDSVLPLKGQATEGKPVRITALVEPYDESKLCAAGVDLQGREKHLAKSPMLLIKKAEVAKVEEPTVAIIELPAPEPAPMPQAEAAPAPEPAPPQETAKVEEHLPRTASDVPLLGLGGLFAFGVAFAIRRFRTE